MRSRSRCFSKDGGVFITAIPKSDKLPYDEVSFLVAPDFAIRRLEVKGQDQSVLQFTFENERKGPTLQDDSRTSAYLKPPTFVSGGGGLVSTATDYMRFARMLLQGGELDGVRLLGPKTLALMTANHLPGGLDLPRLSRSMFSEATYEGVGFGLGFATTVTPAATLIPGSAGDFFWGGAASTFFWVDPREDLIVLRSAINFPRCAR